MDGRQTYLLSVLERGAHCRKALVLVRLRVPRPREAQERSDIPALEEPLVGRFILRAVASARTKSNRQRGSTHALDGALELVPRVVAVAHIRVDGTVCEALANLARTRQQSRTETTTRAS